MAYTEPSVSDLARSGTAVRPCFGDGRRRTMRTMDDPFVRVDVEPGPGSDDGVSLRWRRAAGGGDRDRVVREVPYESDDGLDGIWHVRAADNAEATRTRDARAVLVEDSSDGAAWLVVGGAHGLVLEHAATGTRLREAYLLLSKDLVF
jgi:hypothetical protein